MERYLVVLSAKEYGNRYLFLVPGEGNTWQVPEFTPEKELYPISLSAVNTTLEKWLGTRSLQTRYVVRLPYEARPIHIYVMAPLSLYTPIRNVDGKWFALDELPGLNFRSSFHGEIILSWLRDAGLPIPENNTLPWWQEDWWEQTQHDLRRQVQDAGYSVSGMITQQRSTYAASVLKWRTLSGSVVRKTIAAPFLYEADLLATLEEKYSRYLPVVLSSSQRDTIPPSCDLLLADIPNESLGSHTPIADWKKIVHLYAQIQSESAYQSKQWLDKGCTDLRLNTVLVGLQTFPDRLRNAIYSPLTSLTEREWKRIGDLVPQWADSLERLKETGLPDTLEHGSLYVENVRWNRETKAPIFVDWSHACVTFPFYGYGTLLLDEDWFGADANVDKSQVEWAYLSAWAAYTGMERLAEAFIVWQQIRYLFIAERQIATVNAFQKLWTNANNGMLTPNGDALHQMRCLLRSSVRRLLAGHEPRKL